MTSVAKIVLATVGVRVCACAVGFCLVAGGSQLLRAQLTGCPQLNVNTPGWQKGTALFPTEITYDVSALGQPELGQAVRLIQPRQFKWHPVQDLSTKCHMEM
ncbi:MAG: hypothetical protein LAO06_15640 [Acidobacteriia bacterium]|nr:hypothetical protein [Terriglobia bacterium]